MSYCRCGTAAPDTGKLFQRLSLSPELESSRFLTEDLWPAVVIGAEFNAGT